MINVAVVGLGHWGPNLARNIAELGEAHLHTLCDQRPEALERFGLQFPGAKLERDYNVLLRDSEVAAVIIATPVGTHFELASAALMAGKHVLVEKPLAQTSSQCLELIRLAEQHGRTLMVGHVFLYSAAVRKVKEYIQTGELGQVLYISSQRLNLGIIRQDVNALWNFGPHDVSILCYWLDALPEHVVASGAAYLQPGVEDVIFLTMNFPGGVIANVHLSWLDPNKVRRMTVVGSQKMVVYDDVSVDAPIMIYDKGIKTESPDGSMATKYQTFGEFRYSVRSGDVVIPQLEAVEPLKAECRHFIECIQKGTKPLTDGYAGLQAVQVLEALQNALERQVPVSL